MNAQETQLLQEFLEQLVRVKGMAKDPQADALITRALSQQPDAGYLLVQRALLQDQALATAKEQIATLQNQLASQSAGSPGFLSSGNLWGNSAASAARLSAAAPASASAPAQPYQAPAAPAPQGFLQGGAGSFLGSMAATAAGVAGGALLFQGIENLLGHHGGMGLPGQLSGQHGLASLPEEKTRHDALDPLTAGDTSQLAADAGLDSIDSDFGNDDGGLSDV
jgi:hypothetical protein